MMAVAGFATAGATILAGAGGHREMPMIWMLAFRKAGRRKTMLQRLLVESVEPSLRAGAERSPVMDEATYAGLRVMMASTMGRAMIASAEGDSIDNVTDGRSMSGLLLRGYFGERLAAVRSGDTGSDIPCAMVGMAIQAQLQRVDRLVGNSRHEISGLLDRMLITVHPDEELPPVYGTTEAIDETELAWWRDRIAEIGAEPRHAMVGEMRPVQANEQAIAALHAWDLRTRQDAEAGGIWSRHPGLLAKGVGHVLRIAGALRLLRDAVQAEIEACDVEAASEYMDWIVLHREALRPLTATGRHDVDLAHKLVVWVGGRRLVRFGASEAVQALRCAAAQRVEDWTPVFNLLVSAGYLRPDLIQPSGPRGGRPVRGFLVHPTLRGADA
jgi:hypothetical protein